MPELDLIIIEAKLLKTTEKAIQVETLEQTGFIATHWIGKSQIHNLPDFASSKVGDEIEIQIPEWLAIENLII